MLTEVAPRPRMQTPTPAAQIDCCLEASEHWTRARLEHLVGRPLRNPALEKIEARRKALCAMPPLLLHPSYAGHNSHAGQPFVTPATISLSRLCGRILYSIAVDTRARCILEAGAGLGLSGMYLGAAAALRPGSRLLTFEISDYAEAARESIRLVFDRGEVHQEAFENFARHLPANAGVDFCFLDSKHDEDTILRNYKSVLGWLRQDSVLVIDDILSNPGSRHAWDTIVRRQDFPFAATIRNRLGFLAR